MRKIIFVLFMIVGCIVAQAQMIETSINVVGNKVRIVVKAVGGSIVGQPSNFTFSIAIPIANSSAEMTVTNLDASRLPTGLNSSGNYTDATYEYFNLTYTGSAGAPPTYADGVEYELVELTFTGSSSAPVTLVSLPNGNPGAPSVSGNWYTYIEIGGIQYSDPPNLFYQTASTDAPQNIVDYSTGIASITTNANISLPVSILNFSGYKNGSKNTLNWTTVTEFNNSGFDVQRSIDGVHYTSIGFVNSLAPGGASSSNISYTFNDNDLVGKKQYYRLNQKDIDGRGKLSNIVLIKGDRSAILGIGGLFPNPASTLVNVIIDAPKRDKVTVMITDMAGKTVIRQQANVDLGSNTVPVDIAKLAGGSYLVKLICQSSDCETAAAKFNKQ